MDEKELAALLEAISSPKPPRTLPEILAIAADDEFAGEMIAYVVTRISDGHEPTHVERIVDVVADCEFRRAATVAALKEVGATRVANIVERAGPAFDSSPLAPSGDAVATYQAELGQTYGVTEVRACLKKWIASNRSVFAQD